MQFLLLTVGLALVCGLQAQEEPPENLEEVSTRGPAAPRGRVGLEAVKP